MSGQFPPGDTRGTDPHQDHYLVHGPYSISGHYYGQCKCGKAFKGHLREHIYRQAQAHIDANQPDGGAA